MLSFSISPAEIAGDRSESAIANVQVQVSDPNVTTVGLTLTYNQFGALYAYCNAQWVGLVNGPTCFFPVSQGTNTIQFLIQGSNSAPYAQSDIVTAQVYVEFPGLTAPVTISPAGVPELSCSTHSAPPAICSMPINLLSGNTWISQHDYSLPGLGLSINLDRTWNSLWPNSGEFLPVSGMFGNGWRSTYEESIQVPSGSFLTYYAPSGNHVWIAYNSTNQTYSVFGPLDDHTTVTYTQATLQYQVTLSNAEIHIFNGAGNLLSLADRNGNTTTLTYDGSNRLSQVKDAAGRIVTFNYATPGYPNLVSTVQDATGTIATYTYS
jgi:YD repeat-containing protein